MGVDGVRMALVEIKILVVENNFHSLCRVLA